MRTIDADALLKKIEEDADFYLVGDDENSKAVGSTLLDVKEQINAMPTVEPQRIRGKWIPHHDEVMLFDGISTGGVSCSECGWKTYDTMHLLFGCPYKYCPKCGAEMREE